MTQELTQAESIEKTVQALHAAMVSGHGVAFMEKGGTWIILQELERRHHPTGDGAGAVLMPLFDRRRSHGDPLSKWDRDAKLAPDLLAAGIVEEVEKAHGLKVGRVCFLHPETLPKNTSGKVERNACQELLEKGELDIVWEWKS